MIQMTTTKVIIKTRKIIYTKKKCLVHLWQNDNQSPGVIL